MPVEPPVEPVPELIRAYRAREPWAEGRLIITPHSAFFSPEAWDDIRREIGRDDARGAAGPAAAERHCAGGVVMASLAREAGDGWGSTNSGSGPKVSAG